MGKIFERFLHIAPFGRTSFGGSGSQYGRETVTAAIEEPIPEGHTLKETGY